MSCKKFFWLGNSLTLLISFVFAILLVAAAIANQQIGDTTITHLLWFGVGLIGFLLLFVVLIQLSYANNWAGSPIVIQPSQPEGIEVAIVFIQGEGIPIDRYCPIAKSIQDAAPNLKIWVGIPQFIGDSPIPRETGLAIDKVLSQMKQEGMPDTDNIFFIAHSVGGIAIQKYLKSFPERAKGQILMGSFLNKTYVSQLSDAGKTEIQYSVPTLTIGGTLDGLARITRIATAFWYQQINPETETDLDNFPVVAIEGATHMQFASGEPVSYVADFDLKPQISDEEVRQQIGQLAYHFLNTQLPDTDTKDSRVFLKEKCFETQQTLQPILDAFLMEGYNGFKPACYRVEIDNQPRNDPKCTAYSPWIQERANPIMAGRDRSPVPFDITAIDSFHRSYTYNPFANPSVHIPRIEPPLNNGKPPCDGNQQTATECTLTVSSVTQALYNFLDDFDTGFFPIAAFSLRSKLNSRQKIWQYAGVSNPNFEETDGSSRGNEINQNVYQWALEHAGDKARQYFDKFGIQMAMGEDSVPFIAAGPLWIWVYPKYNYVTINNEQFCQVKARVMKTPINYFIPSARGFHYCQLLSPATVMEWIYIDGLRAKASCSGTTITYGPLGGGLDKAVRFLLRLALRQTRTKALFKRV
ncbi:hypothetical protein AY599_26570 [Leptolyngbya valderiana BDU 20041]|nr:hypothetical protein AY599_26570 [Leptolyngbya valderiana BDU 20041]